MLNLIKIDIILKVALGLIQLYYNFYILYIMIYLYF